MKTRIFLLVALFAMISTSTVSAQFYKRKKVAVTEVVDPSGKVAESTKAYIRNRMSEAVTNSEDYEAYVSISFLSLEANFDRNGNISEATFSYVKKQQMDYVLKTAINITSKNTAQLIAYIYNSSTGLVVAMKTIDVYTDLDSLRIACTKLTYELVGAI